MKQVTIVFIVCAIIIVGLFIFWQQDAAAPTENRGDKNQNGDIAETVSANLYYYNPARDTDEQGNIKCSPDGLVAVEREIPVTETPIQDTIKLLLEGKLTAAEQARGIETEYPLPGFTLEGANLQDSLLTLAFNDPQGQTVGGSCRTGILWFQIAETAKQFPAVEEVQFQPEELFQP